MEDAKYCSNCGKNTQIESTTCPTCDCNRTCKGKKNRIAAGVLAILLGGLGVHKFYLGKVGQGIIYLLFCWTGIPGIIGLIEGILYLCMTDQEFAAKYG